MPTDANPTPGQTCPGAATLEAFALAEHGTDEAVASHVAACERCRGMVEEVRENHRFLHEFDRELRPNEDLFEDPFAATEEIPGYAIQRELHRGAQGVVYLATQERTRRDVAVKMLLQGAFATSRQRARFEREAEIASQLRHPNIVTVYDSMPVKGGRFALVMEYIEGRTLDQWSESLATLAPRNRIAAVVELFLQVIDAVHYAHQRGVIHRDLKPANILVDADGRPRIVDFGIAKLHDAAQADRAVAPRARAATAVTREGEFAGTLAYAAPEQLGGRPDLIDTRTDVYALGVIFHELLTGRMPYDVTGSFAEVIDHVVNEPPAPLRQVLPEADEDLAVIVEHCLAKEPERRYQSAGELLADLRHRLAGEAINAEAELSLLNMGTGGDFRKTFDMGVGLEPSLQGIAEGRVRRIDVGCLSHVSAQGQADKRYFANIASFGLSGEVVDRVNKARLLKRFTGPFAYTWGSLSALVRFKPRPVRLKVDDVFDDIVTISTCAVCNGQYFGGGMKVAPDAVADDGFFDVIVMGAAPLRQTLSSMNDIYTGAHVNNPNVRVFRGRSVIATPVEATSGAAVHIEADGESPGRLPAMFEILPRAIKLRG